MLLMDGYPGVSNISSAFWASARCHFQTNALLMKRCICRRWSDTFFRWSFYGSSSNLLLIQ